MKWLAIIGLALQLVGTWFLCRVFYRVNRLVRKHSQLWEDHLPDTRWSRFWSAVGKYTFNAPKLPESPGFKADEVTGNPSATFAFCLIAAGTACQVVAAILSP